MTFEKPLMTIRELQAMGFNEENLRCLAITEGFPLVVKENGRKTSPIKFDTEELMKYIKVQTTLWQRSKE